SAFCALLHLHPFLHDALPICWASSRVSYTSIDQSSSMRTPHSVRFTSPPLPLRCCPAPSAEASGTGRDGTCGDPPRGRCWTPNPPTRCSARSHRRNGSPLLLHHRQRPTK